MTYEIVGKTVENELLARGDAVWQVYIERVKPALGANPNPANQELNVERFPHFKFHDALIARFPDGSGVWLAYRVDEATERVVLLLSGTGLF